MFRSGDKVRIISEDHFNGLSGVVISAHVEQWGDAVGQDVLVRVIEDSMPAHVRFTDDELTIDEQAVEQERVLRQYINGRVAREERF